jgi:predicted DNA-binding protein (MmcQ/YjbR family)
MNKVHWNTIDADGLPDQLIREMIQHSYDLVVKKSLNKRGNNK